MKQYIPFFLLISIFFSCAESDSNNIKNVISESESRFYNGKGIGPISNLILFEPIDTVMSDEGSKLFFSKCITCHQLNHERKIGPGLGDVTKRRTPEWIMNQVLNPLEMTHKDSLSRELLSIYLTQMTPMDISEKEARAILEFLRTQ